MTGKLDWKWIALGVVVMVAVSLLGALIIGFVLGSQVQTAARPEDIAFGRGHMMFALAINVLSFLIGGFIVGVRSAGRTILEPGISALIAILIILFFSKQLNLANLIIGGLIPFGAGVLGGWLGERVQNARRAA